MADISKPVIVKSPIVHTCGSNLYIIHPETEAAQVKVSETTRLNEQLETINRAIAGSSAIRFTNNIAERNTLTNILPGDRVWVYNAQDDPDVGTSIPAMYIWTPDKQWKRVGEAAAINIKDFIEEDAGLAAEGNRLKVSLDDTLTLTPTGKVAVKNPMWNTEEYITENCEWEAPVTGWYEVTCISGGCGSFYYQVPHGWEIANGSSGSTNTAIVHLQKGQVVPVVIGAAGQSLDNIPWSATVNSLLLGGSTSFGDINSNNPYLGYFNTWINYYPNGSPAGFTIGLHGGGLSPADWGTTAGPTNLAGWYGSGASIRKFQGFNNNIVTYSEAGPGCVILRYYDASKDKNINIDMASSVTIKELQSQIAALDARVQELENNE